MGYFNIIDFAKNFVFLDNVQFERRSWQQRNKIKTPKGLEWITVPIKVKGKREQKIYEAEIKSDEKFPESHIKSLELNYKGCPFYKNYINDILEIYYKNASNNLIVQLNSEFIETISKLIGIETKFSFSSEINATGKKSKLLAAICRHMSADLYVSTPGAREYLLNDKDVFDSEGIKIGIMDYQHPVYAQRFGKFQMYACILDILFNEGPNTLSIIRSGRKEIKIV